MSRTKFALSAPSDPAPITTPATRLHPDEWRVVCPEPDCGWVGRLEDTEVIGADDGCVFCPRCEGEFRPSHTPERRTKRKQGGTLLPGIEV